MKKHLLVSVFIVLFGGGWLSIAYGDAKSGDGSGMGGTGLIEEGESGIGGTGVKEGGSGIGGTGVKEGGSGIGGTGMTEQMHDKPEMPERIERPDIDAKPDIDSIGVESGEVVPVDELLD